MMSKIRGVKKLGGEKRGFKKRARGGGLKKRRFADHVLLVLQVKDVIEY